MQPPPPPPDIQSGPDDPWQDTEFWVQARHDRSVWYVRRENAGYYEGPMGNRTWVPPVGFPLDTQQHQVPGPIPGAISTTGPFSRATPHGIVLNRPRSSGPQRHPGSSYPSDYDRMGHATGSVYGQGYNVGVDDYSRRLPEHYDEYPRGLSAHNFAAEDQRRSDHGFTPRHSPPLHYDSEDQSRHHGRELVRERSSPYPKAHPAKKAKISKAPVAVGDSPAPRIDVAPRNQAGHPVGPWMSNADSGADEDDFGDDNIDEDEETIVRKETERLRTVSFRDARNKTAGKVVPPRNITTPSAGELGPWHGATISTVEQAKNLIGWIASGDQASWKFFMYTRQRNSSFPSTRRSIGEIYLIRRQDSIQNSWEAATGQQFLSKRKQRKQALAASRVDEDHTMGDVLVPPRLPIDDSVPYSAEVRESNARNERAAYYAAQPTTRWPLGMRTSLLKWPVQKFDTVLNEDTIAWAIVRDLAPGDGNNSFQSHQHHMFINATMGVFSIPGYYQRLLELGNYPVGNRVATHFPFLTDNITHSQVAAWFAMHGLSVTGENVVLIESLFCSRRHAVNRDIQTSLAIFADGIFPRRPEDIETVVGVPQWQHIRFDAVAPGRVTDISQTPGVLISIVADPPMVIDEPGTVTTTAPVSAIEGSSVASTPSADNSVDVPPVPELAAPHTDAV